MKKLLAAILLITTSTLQAQQWSEVLGDVNGNIFYLDFSTLRNEGDLRRIWALTNFPIKNSKNELSERVRWEFSCKKEIATVLSSSTFSEKNAAGFAFRPSDLPGRPYDLAPNTAGWSLMEIVCKAKLP